MKRFNGVCLVTRDVMRLRKFYETVLETEAQGDETFVGFTNAGAVLSIFSDAGMEQMAPGSLEASGNGRYTLEFEVENVDDEYQRLTQFGVRIVKPPTTQLWGRRSVWFRDPDGNIINFYANTSPAPRNESLGIND